MSAGATLAEISASNPDERWRREQIVDAAVVAAICGDIDLFSAALEDFLPEDLPVFFGKIRRVTHVAPASKEFFEDVWVEGFDKNLGLAGLAIRLACRGRKDVLADGLKVLLPPPPPGIRVDIVYRAQSVDEYERGLIGFSWTSSPTAAEIFASHSVLCGGRPSLVIAALNPSKAIICLPKPRGELEVICDPRMLHHVTILDRPPMFDGSSIHVKDYPPPWLGYMPESRIVTP
ncbi:hypothetical protein NS228_12845 [Methylobacterium indicum]|uniref:hypothetical protein n=1 Tax=Methylobacterium indicum TaxID=1775910 RepID=UPI0007345990|nr:hypothetical protein [Methylobacterium indicum]KTS30479.1 hypothetical protein NS229_16255 [Methylobacterium indicum]KTS40027.1 hypothetical protein NS228_12845 [Methylobacterium indicum]KTS53637.1 hypothetical protein NS230_04985 [Methylobacterium indicum]